MVAVGIFRDGPRLLVGRGSDPVKRETFLRPLGGQVEFGERAADALRREIMEEIRAEITEPRRLGVLENVFTYDGRPGHEFVVVFESEFVDRRLYDRSHITIHEEGWGGQAIWVDLTEPTGEPLYPTGLSELLESSSP